MKNDQKIDLGMTGYAELFMTDEERKTQTLPRIVDIPLELIDEFPDHPFQVRMDEDMQQLVESIKDRGLITPIILRKKEDDRYEIVSGHRRKKACEIAGFGTIKAEVRDMTRDEAIIMMVESNLQRSVILPSEKAKSYKMRLEAMKRQGQRNDLTSRPVGDKLDDRRSGERLGDAVGESERQIQRYIRLNELIPPILDMVDEGKIALRPAVELSYLKQNEQEMLVEAMEYLEGYSLGCGVPEDMSEGLREIFHEDLQAEMENWGAPVTWERYYKNSLFYMNFEQALLPRVNKEKPFKYEGYVLKEELAEIEVYEREEFSEWLTQGEYDALSDNRKRQYVFHRWNEQYGEYWIFRTIAERVWALRDLFVESCEDVIGDVLYKGVADSQIRLFIYRC